MSSFVFRICRPWCQLFPLRHNLQDTNQFSSQHCLSLVPSSVYPILLFLWEYVCVDLDVASCSLLLLTVFLCTSGQSHYQDSAACKPPFFTPVLAGSFSPPHGKSLSWAFHRWFGDLLISCSLVPSGSFLSVSTANFLSSTIWHSTLWPFCNKHL